MQMVLKLLLICLLGCVGIGLAGAAVYGALYSEPKYISGYMQWKLHVGLGVLAVWCGIGIKALLQGK